MFPWNKNSKNKRQSGQLYEAKALHYLQQQGLKLLEKNFNSKLGEIDLIMQDKQHLVFIEVRYRHNNQYGSAEESVDDKKQGKIKKTALFYLQKSGQSAHPCRFDVVAFNQQQKLHWIKNAFN